MLNTATAAPTTSRGWRFFTIFRELFKEYGTTFLTESAVALSLLLTFKLAAHEFGTEGFSEYAIARRTISLLFPFLVLGLPVALPRYIGRANGDPSRCTRYYGATLWCQAALAGLAAACIILFRKEFAYVFFGSETYASLAVPVTLILAGLSLHAVVYNYFRGNLALRHANSMQLITFAVVPMVSFYHFGTSVYAALTAWGAGTVAVATAALLWFTPWRNAVSSRSWSEARELLHYGIPRIPGSFALLALMTLPATFTVHLRGVQEGGFVAFSTSLLNMVGAMFTPIGVVLLPKASQMCAEGAYGTLRTHVIRIVKLTLIVALGFTLTFEIFAGVIIRAYLGKDFSRVIALTRVVALGALPFALFYVLQGLIDAHHTRAVNALNCIYSLAIFIAACAPSLVYAPEVVIPWALVAGILSLGLLTVRESRRLLHAES
jgi:O-antigen/teichoic acid export membrane protein